MSNQIHPSAQVGKSAKLGNHNVIGPNVIIEDGVTLGSGNKILANAYLCSGTSIGSRNEIHMSAVIGHAPQDVAYKGAKTFTKIGSDNLIREFVTIHRGTKEGTSTVIGDHNFIMANAHVAHNCVLGNRVIMVNLASLTGHCVVEDMAFLSGMTGFHQFTKIGTLAMVRALSAINKDIPPYMICGGRPGVIQGINVVGLRRAGISQAIRTEIKESYRFLYRSGLNVEQALKEIEKNFKSKEIAHLIEFIRTSKRGICAGPKDYLETLLPKKSNSSNDVDELDSEEDLL